MSHRAAVHLSGVPLVAWPAALIQSLHSEQVALRLLQDLLRQLLGIKFGHFLLLRLHRAVRLRAGLVGLARV